MLNNKGWGYRMMALIMFVLVSFLFIAIYYIYNYYDDIIRSNNTISEVRK